MKKTINKIFLFLVVFSFGILNVFADNIDPSRDSSLTVSYQYDDISITDSLVSIYFLASVDASGNYQFQNSYLDIAFDPAGITASDISLKAEEILSYINKLQISSDFNIKTNQEGISNFSNLVPGLYLVTASSKTLGDYRYDSSPNLLTIPTLENGTYQYNVLMNVKTEREKIEQVIIPPGDVDNGEKVPNTLDNIYLYVGLLIISILVIIGVIIYILKKKGEGKNENKNKE